MLRYKVFSQNEVTLNALLSTLSLTPSVSLNLKPNIDCKSVWIVAETDSFSPRSLSRVRAQRTAVIAWCYAHCIVGRLRSHFTDFSLLLLLARR